MNREDFEALLDKATEQLGKEVRKNDLYHKPADFENRVREVLISVASGEEIQISNAWHPHAFPDIRANGFGIEVKSTSKDSWQSVGNSVFEGMRDPAVKEVYIVFGKMGGMPSVQWGRYEERITHVRISHAPRFVIEMDMPGESSIFGRDKMGVNYETFSGLSPEQKMKHVRDYSRGRLQKGERLWWLEDFPGEATSRPLEVRLYMNLPQVEKIKLRAESALLCPQIVGGSRVRNKYRDAALYLLTYHGVFCPQARDLFSAGSVALRSDGTRGGNYLMRALRDIEQEMRDAAFRLEDALFEEYWGANYAPADRISVWLSKADELAKGWKPSDHLFRAG